MDALENESGADRITMLRGSLFKMQSNHPYGVVYDVMNASGHGTVVPCPFLHVPPLDHVD